MFFKGGRVPPKSFDKPTTRHTKRSSKSSGWFISNEVNYYIDDIELKKQNDH